MRALAVALLLGLTGAASAAPYSMADYATVPKVDAHMHLHEGDPAFVQAAAARGFRVLTINVDYPDFPPVVMQQRTAEALRAAAPKTLAWAATFPSDWSGEAWWLDATRRRVDDAMAAGAVGVKVWKNVGMQLRDAKGRLVMVDDARFSPLFDHLVAKGYNLLGHQGEPRNCWLPLKEMTVNNDREYFRAHPQYHMHLHPEFPSYEDQMAARDRMLAQHPDLKFVGVHLASLEWSFDELARFLDRNPRAFVDVAARIGQIQHQSQQDREKVRAFFERYQDRLLYGSDLAQAPGQAGKAFFDEADKVWRAHWRYFNTAETFRVPELDRPVRGLALDRRIVDKLYHLNAERAFPTAWGR